MFVHQYYKMLFSCWETTSYAIIQENTNDVDFVQLKAWNHSLSTIYKILHFIKSVCFKYFDTMSVWDQDIGHIVNNKTDSHCDIEQIWHLWWLASELKLESGSNATMVNAAGIQTAVCFVDLCDATCVSGLSILEYPFGFL